MWDQQFSPSTLQYCIITSVPVTGGSWASLYYYNNGCLYYDSPDSCLVYACLQVVASEDTWHFSVNFLTALVKGCVREAVIRERLSEESLITSDLKNGPSFTCSEVTWLNIITFWLYLMNLLRKKVKTKVPVPQVWDYSERINITLVTVAIWFFLSWCHRPHLHWLVCLPRHFGILPRWNTMIFILGNISTM